MKNFSIGHRYGSESALSRFDRFLRSSTDDLLGKDKERRERAQNLLRLSLPWLVESQGLKPEQALPLIGRAKRERTRTASLRRDLLQLLGRAPASQLMNLSLVSAFFETALAEEVRSRQSANRELSRSRDREAAQRAELDESRVEVQRITDERDQLASRLSEIEARLRDQKELRAIDRTQITARFRGFLKDRLYPLIKDARGALDFEPPHLDGTRQRLEMTAEAIKRELANTDE